MIALVTLFFYVCGFLAAIDAIMRSRTAQGAIGWAVSLVAFPFLSVPAYLVFGRNKFHGMVEAFEQNQDAIEHLMTKIHDNLAAYRVTDHDPMGFLHAAEAAFGINMTRGNEARLLIDGEATFQSILEGIGKAQDYILFQFYIVRDDRIGRELKDALVRKARDGVRVFFLYDEVGSFGLASAYLNELRAAGVEVSSFKPTQGRSNRFQQNFRNHRKIVVTDGLVGWVGGLNVGDEYLGRDPKMSPWRDTHVRLCGPVVSQLQSVFLTDWYWATRELPELNWTPVAVEDGVEAIVLPFAPTQRLETAGLFYVAALQRAQHRIWISAPYFVPDEAVMKALEIAVLRGVDVRIIVPGKSDNLVVQMAAYHYIDLLRDLGIKFYAFEPGFLHEKTFLVDDDLSHVGTANFDNRSFRLNFEVAAVIRDKEFARQMEAMFKDTMAGSVEIDPAAFDDKPFFWHLGKNLARLLSPVL